MNVNPPNSGAAVLPAPVGLGHNRRLLKHADFQRVYKQGRRHFGSQFTVFYLKREGAAGPRIGLAVGRAIGGAVDRNRMKRRLREAVRANFPAGLHADLVIHPRKPAGHCEFAGLSPKSRGPSKP